MSIFRVTAILAMTLSLAACQSTPQRVSPAPVESEPMTDHVPTYSNDIFRDLVARYADEQGQVDYGAWQASAEDMALLDQQVQLIAQVSPTNQPDQFTSAQARSYWINTYNTLVVDAVLDYWPLDSVRDVNVSLTSRVVPGKGFFYDRKVVVGGLETNLYHLEKQVLKSQKDPRIHFALNCASGSCPVLRPWEWTEEQLEQASRDFVNNPENVRVGDGEVYLNRIFKWYRKDFPEDTFAYLRDYAESPLRESLKRASEGDFATRYLDYDWELNDASQ